MPAWPCKISQSIVDKNRFIEVKRVCAEIWDRFSCLEKYREIFAKEKGNHIHVNVSMGSKIIAMAGILSCMLWGGSPYYARLDYEDGGPTVGAEKHKVAGTDTLPVYQINIPLPESLQVLSFLDRAGGSMSKKKLIEQLQSPKVRMIPVYLQSQPRSVARSLLWAILEPLSRTGILSRGERENPCAFRRGMKASPPPSPPSAPAVK